MDISVGEMDPTLAVADTPLKPIAIASGVIEPTLAVAETPTTSINSTADIVMEPTDIVLESPVRPMTSAGVSDPTLAVAATPVIPTPISGTIDPTLAVADTPVKLKSPGPNNNPGVPKEAVDESPVRPIAISVGEIDPTLAVADKPVIEIVVAFSPQFSNPQVSRPHPDSG